KKRILEIYLNSAEFGKGIYGVEAAARYYFKKPARHLSVYESIELAATLPAPVNHNPQSRTEFFLKRVKKISRHMGV
ncbi:transglycosylase domain-containing protein, partial [Kaarinaea lacus]